MLTHTAQCPCTRGHVEETERGQLDGSVDTPTTLSAGQSPPSDRDTGQIYLEANKSMDYIYKETPLDANAERISWKKEKWKRNNILSDIHVYIQALRKVNIIYNVHKPCYLNR